LIFNKGDSSSGFEDIRLALVHHLVHIILPREAKNVDFMDGSSDSIHSLDDEKDTSCKPTALKFAKKGLVDMLDTHVGETLGKPK
jgi:hypothetical protein